MHIFLAKKLAMTNDEKREHKAKNLITYVKRNLNVTNVYKVREALPIQYAICNIKENSYISIADQNASGFDNHLILPKLAERLKE